MLYQVITPFRADLSGTDDGMYYWSQDWTVEAVDLAHAHDIADGLAGNVGNFLIPGAWSGPWQLIEPVGSGLVVDSRPTIWTQRGGTPDSDYTLLSCMYVWLLFDDDTIGYKRIRAPWLWSQVAGGVFDDAAMTQGFGTVNVIVGLYPIRSRNGATVREVLPDRRVHPWQLRTGTKRRNRSWPFV